MKGIIDVKPGTVREIESYTLLNKDSYNNICKKEIVIKLQKSSFLLLSFCV